MAYMDRNDIVVLADEIRSLSDQTYMLKTDGEALEEEVEALVDKKAPAIVDYASGKIASFSDGAEAPLKSLIFSIEPQQDLHGFDYPWPGGGGVNKFNSEATTLNGFTRSGDTFTNSQTDTRSEPQILVQAFNGNTYLGQSGTFVSKGNNRYGNYYAVPAEVTRLRIKHNGQTKDLTIDFDWTTAGTIYVSLEIVSWNPTTVGGFVIRNVMIALTETYSPYSPYSNICPISGTSQVDGKQSGADMTDYTPITIDLGRTVYGGTVDVLAGEGDSNLGSVTLDGTTLTYAHNGVSAGHTNALVTIPDKANGTDNIMSDRFVYGATNQAGRMVGRAASNKVEFSLPIEVSTVAEVKAWFASNPTQLVYELATPLEYDLTPVTGLTSLLGQNNIWHSAGETEVEYVADTKLFIERLTAPTEDDFTANANIASGKFFMVGNDLYLSTAAIAIGETISPGTNCTKLSLAQALNQLNS